MTDYSRLDPRLVTESNKQDIVGVFLNWLSLALRPVIKGFLRLTTRYVGYAGTSCSTEVAAEGREDNKCMYRVHHTSGLKFLALHCV